METIMVAKNFMSGRLGRWAAGCAVALLLSGGHLLAGAPAAVAQVASPAPPPGAARIWFYRDYEPYGTRSFASVALNGVFVGYAQPEGTVFYRDIPPGRYRVTVGAQGQDVNQDAWIDLAPGQQAFVKVLGTNSWDTGGDNAIYSRDTYYARVMPPQIAQAEIAR
jgi:hypothetical protein